MNKISNEIPKNVLLVAVSKAKPISDIKIAYNSGQLHFGENKIQELTEKENKLPKNIKWHMIGHLQRNKVKYIASFIYMIHSVDSIKLLKEINKQAIKNNRNINVLIQVDISEDSTKFGFSFEEINKLLLIEQFKEFQNVSIKGLMGMASLTSDKQLIRKEFNNLNDLYKNFKNKYSFEYLSMGMSSDYKIAIKC
ncbi:uncharacterized protein METZ01_LOCUS106266, partial [marine metagenome]